jgi:hypothetical protein
VKRNPFVEKCGPYRVVSLSCDGSNTVKLVVYPRYGQYGDWPEQRMAEQGGGPGLFTNISLAEEMEAFLNQRYNANDVECWHKRINQLAGLHGPQPAGGSR